MQGAGNSGNQIRESTLAVNVVKSEGNSDVTLGGAGNSGWCAQLQQSVLCES